jgi:hypothetical protein
MAAGVSLVAASWSLAIAALVCALAVHTVRWSAQ